MSHVNNVPEGLPSSRTLVRSTLIAVGVAAVLLVGVVLPAEYGVDPVGVGRILGLTEMGEIKMALAREADAAAAAERVAVTSSTRTAPTPSASGVDSAVPATVGASDSVRRDSVQVVLAPGEGREIKLVMLRGSAVRYAWSSDAGGVNYETHGDTLNAPAGVFHSYNKGRGARADSGRFVAVFDGQHGWYWRNRNSGPVTVTLRMEGVYSEIKRLP
jgi:hypothetical protein